MVTSQTERNRKARILVTGAGGKTGRAIIRALAEAGVGVRALVFRTEQIERLRDLGAMIETRRSTWLLLVLVLASAIAGNLSCSGNAFASGSPNTVSGTKSGQCSGL